MVSTRSIITATNETHRMGEFHNQMTIDIDPSAWAITGISVHLPEGTIISAAVIWSWRVT